jgi:molecular chaperone DnaK
VAEGRQLVRDRLDRLDRLRPLLDRIAGWNATIVQATTAEPDLLRRFRRRHDSGDYGPALATHARLGEPLTDAPDVRRLLRCLAHTHQADRYREVLTAHAGLLGVELGDPGVPLRQALVRVDVARPDGTAARRLGFLVAGGTAVVTNRNWLTGADFPNINGVPVTRVQSPDNTALDVAVLRLDQPLQGGLRLGHAALVGVGGRVFAATGADPAGGESIVDGLVDRLESFAERDLTLFRVGLRLPSTAGGGPLVNDLGEAVGILVIGDQPTGGAFALIVDAFAALVDDV